jgi:hypothetical protein
VCTFYVDWNWAGVGGRGVKDGSFGRHRNCGNGIGIDHTGCMLGIGMRICVGYGLQKLVVDIVI